MVLIRTGFDCSLFCGRFLTAVSTGAFLAAGPAVFYAGAKTVILDIRTVIWDTRMVILDTGMVILV